MCCNGHLKYAYVTTAKQVALVVSWLPSATQGASNYLSDPVLNGIGPGYLIDDLPAIISACPVHSGRVSAFRSSSLNTVFLWDQENVPFLLQLPPSGTASLQEDVLSPGVLESPETLVPGLGLIFYYLSRGRVLSYSILLFIRFFK